MPIIRQILDLSKQIQLPPVFDRECWLCKKKGTHCHGTYPRYSLGQNTLGKWTIILVVRFFCLHCKRTFSILPYGFVRRVGKALPCLIGLVSSRLTWDALLEMLGVARNTLAHWKRLGKLFMESAPKILDTLEADWSILTLHLSRLQYPNNLRKSFPPIP